MSDKKQVKCTGKFKYCWSWNEFSTGGEKSKGLDTIEMIDMKTMKPSRSIPYLRHGIKKQDTICLNYCPWCGADYEKLGRV